VSTNDLADRNDISLNRAAINDLTGRAKLRQLIADSDVLNGIPSEKLVEGSVWELRGKEASSGAELSWERYRDSRRGLNWTLRLDADWELNVTSLKNRDAYGLPNSLRKSLHDRKTATHERALGEVCLPHLKSLHTKTIVLGLFVLIDVATQLKGGEETEHVVLVQLETLGELSHSNLSCRFAELLKHIKSMRYGLDHVIRFLALHKLLIPDFVFTQICPKVFHLRLTD
jgi:hypothetical protein